MQLLPCSAEEHLFVGYRIYTSMKRKCDTPDGEGANIELKGMKIEKDEGSVSDDLQGIHGKQFSIYTISPHGNSEDNTKRTDKFVKTFVSKFRPWIKDLEHETVLILIDGFDEETPTYFECHYVSSGREMLGKSQIKKRSSSPSDKYKEIQISKLNGILTEEFTQIIELCLKTKCLNVKEKFHDSHSLKSGNMYNLRSKGSFMLFTDSIDFTESSDSDMTSIGFDLICEFITSIVIKRYKDKHTVGNKKTSVVIKEREDFIAYPGYKDKLKEKSATINETMRPKGVVGSLNGSGILDDDIKDLILRFNRNQQNHILVGLVLASGAWMFRQFVYALDETSQVHTASLLGNYEVDGAPLSNLESEWLRRVHMYLIKNMDLNNSLLETMVSSGLISRFDQQRVLHTREKFTNNAQLLHILHGKTQGCFERLIECLTEAGQPELAHTCAACMELDERNFRTKTCRKA